MKAVLFLSALACSLCCWGQAPDDSKPAPTNIAGQTYPRIYADNRVAFQLKAPDAQKVQVQLGKTYDMDKGTDGVWSVTLPPQVVGFHYYFFIIDGVQVSDPASESFFGVGRQSSGIEIPEPDAVSAYSTVQDVPHGVVRLQRYYSKVTGQWRRCFIYTPPGFDKNKTATYPVLFLMPGGGEDDRGWFNQGRADIILDNLIAAGKAEPMIAVTDNQFSALKPGEAPLSFGPRRPAGGTPAGGPPAGGPPAGGPPPAGQRMPPMDFGNYGLTYTDVLIHDLIPFLEANYRVIPKRESRAMAGLSMGGMQTFITTLSHLDTFAYIGGFSPGLPQTRIDAIYKDPAGFNKQVKVLFLGTGSVEAAGNPNIVQFHEALDKAGIHNVFYESPGTAHEWLTWRRDLYEFAPRLFRETAR